MVAILAAEEFMAENYVYLFRQSVERIERQDQSTEPVAEQYVRTGVMRFESSTGLTTASRVLTEYLSTDTELAAWRRRSEVPLEEMTRLHAERAAAHRLPFGPPEQTEILSEPNYADAVLLGVSVPVHGLAWLGVVPGLTGFEPKVDVTWESTISLSYGFGIFKAGYRVRVAKVSHPSVHLEIQCHEKPVQAVGQRVVLRLQPSGSAKLALNLVDRQPERYEGKFSTGVWSDWRENQQQRSLELSRSVCSFRYVRIPAAFNSTSFLPTGWTILGPDNLAQ